LKEPPKRARKTGADGTTFKHLYKDYAMRHSHTSRISAKTILAFVGLGLAGACSDSVSGPTKVVSAKAPAAYTEILGVTSFVYDPDHSLIQRFGDHVIVIPANGVCDLSSSYGPGTWDDDCAPLTHSIIITATTYADAEGHPYVDFEPALRFVPTKETDLYLKDGKRDRAAPVQMTWCNALFVCVDESVNDPSVATHRIGQSRNLVRRIKHFSGYNLTSGDDFCPGSVTPDPDGGWWCETDGDRSLERSGYMLASGLDKSGGATTGVRRKKAKQ
jgi:hypothetical protein